MGGQMIPVIFFKLALVFFGVMLWFLIGVKMDWGE